METLKPQLLAVWEKSPASKDPRFISAFEIKTLCALAILVATVTVKDGENPSLSTAPTCSPDAKAEGHIPGGLCGQTRGQCQGCITESPGS